MGQTFDPKAPHGEVFGTSVAKYYQGGRYFDGRGRELTERDENGEFVPNDALKGETQQTAAGSDSTDAVAELRKRTTFEVKSVYLEAGGDPELAKGKGAKKRMIDWLVQQLDDSQ